MTVLDLYNMNLLQREIIAIRNPSLTLEMQKIKSGKNFRRMDKCMSKTSLFKKEFRFIGHLGEVDPDKSIKFFICHCHEDG